MNKKRQTHIVLSVLQKISLIFLGVLISLLLLEGGLRLGGFILSSFQEFENFNSTKQKNTYRILCVGESTTAGQYPRFLEQVLNRRRIGVRFSVIDKGRAAMNTITLLEDIESNLNTYHPDMVIAMMGINDLGKHMPFDKPAASTTDAFIRSFKVYKLARFLELNLMAKAKSLGFYGPQKNNSARAETSRILHEKRTQAISASENVYLEAGDLYKDQGKFLQAEEAYRKALGINSGNDHTYVELGWLYRIQRKYSGAETFYQKALELNPRSQYAYDRLGWLYRDRGRLVEAETAFKKCLGLDPNTEYAYYGLAVLYRDQGRLPEAADCLKSAIRVSPQSERSLKALASLYREMGKPELAQAYTEKMEGLKSKAYPDVTVRNYLRLKAILDQKKIRLVCVQYPMRKIEPLKKIFENNKGAIFVDNERVFKEAVERSEYKEYFKDMFAGDFGHCTRKGNILLAENIADVILGSAFGK